MTRRSWGRSGKGNHYAPRPPCFVFNMDNQLSLFTGTLSKLGVSLQAFADFTVLLDLDGSVLEYRFDSPHLQERFPILLHSSKFQEILSPERANDLERQLLRLRENGETLLFEFSITTPEKRWFDSRISMISDTQILLSAREITSYKHTENQLEQQTRQRAASRSIDLAIASGLDLKLLLSMLLDQAIKLLRVDAASILLFNSETNLLTFSSGAGFQTNNLQEMRLKLGEGFAGKVAMERKTVSIPDLRFHRHGFARQSQFTDEGFVAYYGLPLLAKGKLLGVLEFFNRTSLKLDPDWVEFVGSISSQAAIAIDNATLFKDLQRASVELSIAYDATIEGWSRALDLRDKETEKHTRRVTDLTTRLAHMMGMEKDTIINIRRGAALHDIGKVAIPDEILFKPGPLTEDEWRIMRQHPAIAVNLLSPIAYLAPALDIPRWHHERWNGGGYPDRLSGEQIPLSARLFAVIDVYDALTSDRPYRSAWSRSDAIAYIESQSGSHFDPRVVMEFMKLTRANEYDAANIMPHLTLR